MAMFAKKNCHFLLTTCLLLIFLEETLAMAESFEWLETAEAEGNANNNNAKAKLVIQHFGRALKVMPQKKWAKLRNKKTSHLDKHRFSRQDTASPLGDLRR